MNTGRYRFRLLFKVTGRYRFCLVVNYVSFNLKGIFTLNFTSLVENVAEDGVEPKPGKNKAFGECKPTNDVKFKVKVPFQVEAHIVNNQAKPVPTGNFEENRKSVPTGVRVIEANTRSFFITIERWKDREELLGWVRRQAARAGFTISIDKSSTITPT